jgi:hypothetical protein
MDGESFVMTGERWINVGDLIVFERPCAQSCSCMASQFPGTDYWLP